MKYPCNLIRDILPLYHDGVVSEESINAVQGHLKECATCKEFYKKMCDSDFVENAVYDAEKEMKTANSYHALYRRAVKKVAKIVVLIVLLVAIVVLVMCALLVGYVTFSAEESKELHRDISEYAMLEDGKNVLQVFANSDGSCIWPQEITDDMDVEEYFLMYYCPWDSNYLGYLTVEYDAMNYEAEVKRLGEYASTDYVGNYGATGFETYDVLAMDADDWGFIYALADGDNTIVYVGIIFPGYGMDIEYEEYVPEEYLPKGLDAGKDNPTRQAVIERNEESRDK